MLEDKTPLIFWNETWVPICAARFSENTNGANLFCKKLDFSSGKISINKSLALGKDAFKVGMCDKNDEWPNCTGGCNWENVGGRCYWKKKRLQAEYTASWSCNKGQSPKMLITCSGPRISRTISSCPN